MPSKHEAVRSSGVSSYRWFRAGDLNAFFVLMFDNVANLVILASILIAAFGFPKEIVLYHMVPGTAIGVLIGDLIYAWMARQLARRTGRNFAYSVKNFDPVPATAGDSQEGASYGK